ncbi:putative lipoprotein [Corallococcus coralloides DSM 2259]|uniref:Putative lipoprotein n=1 Tax=Corallococcus coralloides (strain ATCC 25202 / DSM 2259 / NBRC 100086 / M2) TaxID=1144275 RepID=H8MEW6_CORCM|nr:Ig-like domain-containing protein [Corallococcus coralloides]AFE04335.1 putative lipoprotein [Corallococcus coralloides DSM 2259]
MSYLFLRWLTASATALRTGLVLGLAASTLAACRDDKPSPSVPPVARSVSLETVEDTPLAVQLPASGNGALTFTIVDAPDHGTLSEIGANGAITYTPGADYNGEDALVYRATNSQGQSAQGTVTLTITPVNDTPTLSPVANQAIAEDSSTDDLAFTPSDVETPADGLTVTATSSNTVLVPNDPANLVFGGSSTRRTLKVVPAANASGSTTITLLVGDGTATTSTTFTVAVTEVNDVPTLSPVAGQRIPAGSSTGDLVFTVGDVETAADSLTVAATSSNIDLVPNDPANLVFGGSGSSRTLNVVPSASASGSATITLSVSDGSATTSTTFTVDVTAPASLYWTTASGSLWRVDVNGTNAMELKTGLGGTSAIATDPVSRAVFYTRDSAIVRADGDWANPVDVVANGGFPSGLAVDSTNRMLYWSDFNGKRVMRAELDGSNPTQLVGGIDSPSALAVDAPRGKVYVITYNNTVLMRFNLDGTNLETVASGLGGQGVGLAIDSSGGKVYYSTRGGSIYVTNLDGASPTALVTNQSTVHGIAIDVTAGRLYWADWLGTAVRSANLADGGDIQTVNSGGARNLGLAWMPAP